jgi:TfoX/Sxy family transcriptional regulator of competence genes
MASDLKFAEYIRDQVSGAGRITFRKMFGEYALYCDEKVVAFICDNQLFVKPTDAGREFIGNVVEAPPYPGAKMYFLVEDQLDDREWLANLIRVSSLELPAPKPKKPKIKLRQ